MRPKSLAACAVMLGIVTAADAATLNVPGNFATIQQAINASTAGDIVEIGPGTYFEQLSIDLPHNGISLRGTAGATSTVIDAALTGRALVMTGLTAATRIEGLTFRNGKGIGGPGGGLLLNQASPIVADCVVENCEAVAAAGAYVDQCSPTFERCVFRGNSAPGHSGAGLYADHVGTTTLRYCLVYSNSGGAWGSGVTAWEGATLVLEHCTIVGNQATLGGDNVYFTRGGSVLASNSIFAFPSGPTNVEAAPDAGNSSFTCCDLYVTSGSNVVGFPSPVGQNGNFALNPSFCDRLAGDLSLTGNSPCASANSACALVGALDAQCVPVITTRTTWGQAKAFFR